MAFLTPPPKMQFIDANGNPLVGGKLYSYAAGTTTPLATYTSETGGTANTNPVILDASGSANVWLGSALYKFKLTTSDDVELWTVDNVGGYATLAQLAVAGGADLIGYQGAGAGAVVQTVQDKLRTTVADSDYDSEVNYDLAREALTAIVDHPVKVNDIGDAVNRLLSAKLTDMISVKDFGAVGDGTTNDYTAFQNAIDYCHTNFRTLYVPAGTYKINSTLTKASSFYGVNIVGEGANDSVLDFSALGQAAIESAYVLIGGSGSLPNNVVEKLTFKGNQNVRLIEFRGLGGQRFRDCTFDDCLVGGWYHNKDVGSFTEFDVFENCRFNDNCWLAIEYSRADGNDSFHGSGLLNCVVGSTPTQLARVRINPGCHPYNAPMTAQFFMNSSIPIIEHSEPQRAAEFYGTITVETFSGVPTLANGYDVGLAGAVGFLGPAPHWGTLTVTRYQTSDVAGILQSLDSMYVGQPTAINTSTFTDIYIPTGMVRGARLIFVYLQGQFVEATYVLLSLVSPYGFYPTPTLVAKNVCDNGGQSSTDPVFALNSTTSALQIKQGAGPATDVTARIVAYQMGLGAANTGVL